MADLLHNPEYWRARADEARAIAENMRDPRTRKMMLEVAETYEKLAKDAEQRRRLDKK